MRKSMRKTVKLMMTFAAMTAMLAGCGGSEKAPAETAAGDKKGTESVTETTAAGKDGGDKYYIACGAPFTGDDAQYGNFFKKAIDMKVDEINGAGGYQWKDAPD